MEHRWNEIDRGKPKYSEKNLFQCHLSTTYPTWTDPGSNPGLRSEMPATNRLSHGTILIANLIRCLVCEILGFRNGVVEASAHLVCYIVLVDSWLPTFWDNCWPHLQGFFLDCLILVDGTDRLSQNIGNQLPTYTM
jgi:hypothetical protein